MLLGNTTEPLAEIILAQTEKIDVNQIANQYIDIDKGVESAQDAILGAMDIIAEDISDNAKYRKEIKKVRKAYEKNQNSAQKYKKSIRKSTKTS